MRTCIPLFGIFKRKHVWEDSAYGYHWGTVERHCTRCGRYERVTSYLKDTWEEGRAKVSTEEPPKRSKLKN